MMDCCFGDELFSKKKYFGILKIFLELHDVKNWRLSIFETVA